MGDSSHSNKVAQEKRPPYEELEQRLRKLDDEFSRLKERNEALEKRNAKYQAIVESQTEFICRFLPDGTLTFVNNALARRTEKFPEQLINENFYQCFSIDEEKGLRKKLAALSPEKPYVEIEEKIPTLDGRGTWLHWVFSAVWGKEGRLAEIQGVGRDVTELKRMRESLDKSRQRFHYFLENMSEGFGHMDENHVMLYLNRKLCEMLGYEREELVGRTITDLLDEKNKKIIQEQFRKREMGENGSYEITWKKKNGEDLHVLMSPTPRFDEKGIFRGSYSVLTDITRLKQVEQALKERGKVLDKKKTELAEANVALKILLNVRNEGIQELQETIVYNVRHMVTPYLRKLNRRLGEKERTYIRSIESNLNRIVSPLAKNLALKPMGLTPTELQVAALVKDGNSTKEIAALLNVSQRTVDFHRRNIRKKLGLENTKVNLRTHLTSLP